MESVSIAKTNRMNSLKHVAFAGGGSGGHLFPAIAIAQTLLTRQIATQLTFLTSCRPIDQRVIESSGLPTDKVRCIPLPLSSSAGRIAYGIKVARAFVQCRTEMKTDRPEIVIGLGGFASVPGVLAAAWLKIPIVLIETNAIPGAANRFLSRFAKTTFSGWPMSKRVRQSWRSEIGDVGIPLRTEFFNISRTASPSPTLLILGGSQGASRVNELVLHALSVCRNELADWHIIHQVGAHNAATVAAEYQHRGISVDVTEFVQNIPQVLSTTDVIISRCGAVTLAEIAAAGCASVLIPLSSSADAHQQANAQIFADARASRVVDERSADAIQQLTDAVMELCTSSAVRHELSTHARSLATLDATERIVDSLSR
jgi:UDP-N-acetylglucosamine--N-acetylmuramyl-(pentapeptide) pyrophosphoryl-undecaprenol N-acetylglucosamine transferase